MLPGLFDRGELARELESEAVEDLVVVNHVVRSCGCGVCFWFTVVVY